MLTAPAFTSDPVSDGFPGLSDEVVELAFLLPDWQVTALEEAAHRRGLSTAEMLRQILGEYFGRYAD